MKNLMKNFVHKLLFASTLIASTLHAEKITIETTINVLGALQSLSLDDKLTILSVGKFIVLTSKPEIAEMLQSLEAQLDEAYRKAVVKAREHGKTVDELTFKQKMVLALYASIR